MNVYDLYFEKDLDYIERALKSIKTEEFEDALDACTETLRNGKKIIVSGLGKKYLYVTSLLAVCFQWA